MPRSKKPSLVKKDIFVSVVAVAQRGGKPLSLWIKEVTQSLQRSYTNYEVIVVDNGFASAGDDKIADLLHSIACVRVLRLARPAAYDVALFAGLDSAIGDYVCTFDMEFDSIADIAKIVSINQTTPVVQGVSSTAPVSGVMSKLGRSAYYGYTRRYLAIDIPENATNLASYNRTAVNALTRNGRSQKHIRHLVRLLGFRPELYTYTPKLNPSKNHNVRTGLVEALEITASYSLHPLRFITWVGVIAGMLNALYAVYVVILNVVRPGGIAEGWTTTSLQLSAMFFVLFMVMVILAEYIGRILIETRGDTYFIVDEQSSQVSLADENRTNVEK
jgi:polyisoprenyl-phosphate glycosyltransferase